MFGCSFWKLKVGVCKKMSEAMAIERLTEEYLKLMGYHALKQRH